eukprot:gene20662-21340_t
MTMIGKAATRLLRSTALVTCSLGALLAAPTVSQASGTITPYYGSLHPFYGSLHPFYGSLHPFSADVSTTYGDITPFYGSLHPFYGSLHPFTAATDTASVAFYGTSQSNAYWGPGILNPFTWVPTGGTNNQVGPLNYVQYGQIGGFWTNETNTWLPLWQQWQTSQDNSAAAATATANAAALTAAAAADTAAAKTPAAKSAAGSETAAAAAATVAADAQSRNASAAAQALGASLQSFFFGASGKANTSTASLLTFWDQEITSQPKAATLTKVVAAQVYNILKPYGGVATINGNGVVTAIDLTSAANVKALAQTTASDQALLYSNIYDRVMDFSGTDHVDWWQAAANWTPNLARIQMGGTASTTNYATLVGMIDYTVNGSGQHVGGSEGEQGPDNGDGTGALTNGHGAAVYSLIKGAPVIASKEPGCSLQQTSNNYCPGVAGVAQANTYVFVYDPYDSTGSTSFTWDGTYLADGKTKTKTNVGDALVSLVPTVKTDDNNVSHPLNVINASLGVAGWTLNSGWNDALNYATSKSARNTYVLVIAAGNDGSTQTVNVPWTYATNPKLLIVGSIAADGTISSFSNRPGEACLYDTASSNTASSACVAANKLKNRFVVAPGESILVSDGSGSTTRVTGTSLAAPLVTGTVALIEGRWNWLGAQYISGRLTTGAPDVVSNIVLQSATPLGTRATTGVADPVYGMGALNITAANSPLNYNSLFYQTTTTAAGVTSTNYASVGTVRSTVSGGTQTSFNTSNLYLSAFEYFDGNANLISPSGTGVTSQTDSAAVKTAIAKSGRAAGR